MKEIIELLMFFSCLNILVRLTIASLPSFFPVCFRNDPQLSDCIIKSVKALQPRLITGDLGDGVKVPKIDPFYFPSISIGTENVIRNTYSDIYLSGLSNFTIDKLRVNITALKFDMILSFPQIKGTSNYHLILGVFGFPMHSHGRAYETFDNFRIRLTMKGRKYIKNGSEYLQFDPFYIKFVQVNVSSFHFTNLFPNTIFVGPLVRYYLVDNINYLTQNIYPDFEKAYSEAFTKIANMLATGATFDELFPL